MDPDPFKTFKSNPSLQTKLHNVKYTKDGFVHDTSPFAKLIGVGQLTSVTQEKERQISVLSTFVLILPIHIEIPIQRAIHTIKGDNSKCNFLEKCLFKEQSILSRETIQNAIF